LKPQQIKRFVDPARRFHPFVVRTGSGGSYRVASREMMWMPGEGDVVLVYEPGEGVTMIDTSEITELQREVKKRGGAPD
jgi:hypothetical protein